MIATAFDEENLVLDAPPGMTADECEPLSVWRGDDDAGNPVVISCWKPTTEEWKEMQRTGRIWIIVHGRTMPPIAPVGVSPFYKQQERRMNGEADSVATPNEKKCPHGKCDGSGWVWDPVPTGKPGETELRRFQCQCRAENEWVGGA